MSLLLNKKNPVRVSADKAGCIIRQSKNPEYGHIRLVQEKPFVKDSFYREVEVSALFHGPMEKLKGMNLKAGDELIGNIVIKEQLTAFSYATAEKDQKKAGDTGIVCTINGCPIFRKTFYTTASNVEDVLIQHDNIAELQAAYEAKKSGISSTITESSVEDDFSL